MIQKIMCPKHGETGQFIWINGNSVIPPENKYCTDCVVKLIYDCLSPAPLIEENNLSEIKVPEDPIAKEIDKGLEKAEKSISKSIKKAWKKVFG